MKKKKKMQRGRPKGTSQDQRSFGPLGDLLRKSRLTKKIGLAEVAKACSCSVQFISNIEHGRAPLPWEKADSLAKVLGISASSLHTANLTVRSDFGRFIKASQKGKANMESASSLASLAIQDPALQNFIKKYQKFPVAKRASFVKSALSLMN